MVGLRGAVGESTWEIYTNRYTTRRHGEKDFQGRILFNALETIEMTNTRLAISTMSWMTAHELIGSTLHK